MNDASTPGKGPTEDPDADRRPSAYAQYSSIAFQMLATIGLGVYAGMKLDRWQGNQFTRLDHRPVADGHFCLVVPFHPAVAKELKPN